MGNFTDIQQIVDRYQGQISGNPSHVGFDNAAHFHKCNNMSMVWIKAGEHRCQANLIIAETGVKLDLTGAQVAIYSSNSKALFAEIAAKCLMPKPMLGIHPTAHVHHNAMIHDDVSIGPLCSIGECEIGAGTVIDAHVVIHDKVVIGANNRIAAGTVIGAEGSGLVQNAEGKWIPFPQLGGVVLADHVSVGANSYIARGALVDTKIGAFTHIGLSCCIAHNVQIGENTLVLANSTICGGATIGSEVWIAPGATIINKTTIGDGVFIGQASNVVGNIDSGKTVYGNPAKAKQ